MIIVFTNTLLRRFISLFFGSKIELQKYITNAKKRSMKSILKLCITL